jgi:hypothetical protein
MFGIIGTLLLVTWLFDYALAFTPAFVQSPLLVLACLFLAVDFVRSQIIGGDHSESLRLRLRQRWSSSRVA